MGRYDKGLGATKELLETSIKLPRLLQDEFVKLQEAKPDVADKLSTVGHIVSRKLKKCHSKSHSLKE